MRQCLCAIAILVSGLSVLRGDGLIHRLPADGTSVRYDVEVNEGQRTRKGKLIISSVGEETVDGKKCRWIEMKAVDNDDPDEGMIVKMLIPADQLKAGFAPLEHVVRGWLRQGGDRPRAWQDLQPDRKDQLAPFFHPPIKDGKKLANEVIDSKLGKLECAGVQGIARVQKHVAGTTRFVVESRLHDEAPFGVIQMTMQVITVAEGEVQHMLRVTIKLAEISKDAKSELPDQK